ncbi:nucleoside monophosphate kinase [Candidatus Saccharibacteria bacterium]|nr:nucleoside monophosphate kinase [Candidatus Saccharibacteria bacterium]NCU40548.1 nucleoside monophosphate kinase [Candidatus Saccharibacteria bacterium]
MIIFFGPAGSGKSVQGQILAARHGWRWISTGQLLRDTHDAELIHKMQSGALAPVNLVNEIIKESLISAKDLDGVILDGYPRELDQAKWLVDTKTHHGRGISLAIVLEVPRSEILDRLRVRGRVDDNPESIDKRLQIYRGEIYPILDYFNDENIPIVHMGGVGTVGEIHDKIEKELVDRGIVKSL